MHIYKNNKNNSSNKIVVCNYFIPIIKTMRTPPALPEYFHHLQLL